MNITDKLSETEIKKHLNLSKFFTFSISESTESTNTDAKKLAKNGAEEWTVVIAETQTSGKGRMSRKFSSPKGSGIYMSVILRPKFAVEEALSITTSAAVAVSEAIEHLTQKSIGIKWVNDIYMNGKKVCGILTEASAGQGNTLKYAVLGIGINVFEPEGGFPEEIRNIAGAVCDRDSIIKGFRNRLIAEILNRFKNLYDDLPDKNYLTYYRNKSILTAQQVDIIKCGEVCGEGTVEDIDDSFGLIIKHTDGTTSVLSSGEVSVKKKV